MLVYNILLKKSVIFNLFYALSIPITLQYTTGKKGGCLMKVVHTKDTMSAIYLDAVRIRNQVFVGEQGVPPEREIDQDEAYCIHFVLYSDEQEAKGTVRLLPLENGQIKVQRMAILAQYRQQGLGQILIREAEDFAKKQGFDTVKLGAQLSAIPFYEKLDYHPYGEIFEDAGIQHVNMKKTL